MSMPTGTSGGPPPWTITYLDLTMLLMTFFILLNAISSYEKGRTDPVIRSLQRHFLPAFVLEPEGGGQGKSVEEQFVDGLGALFDRTLPLPRTAFTRDGDRAQIELPAERLFVANGAAFVSGHQPFIDGLATMLANRAPGYRYDVQALLGERGPRGTARAAALGKALTVAGAPRDSVAVGFESGPAERLRLVFHIRPIDEPRVDFRGRTN
jgi:hypothetical protein